MEQINNFDLVNRLNKFLQTEAITELEKTIKLYGLEKVTSQEILATARANRNINLVIFLSTLGIENNINTESSKFWHGIYSTLNGGSSLLDKKSTSILNIIKKESIDAKELHNVISEFSENEKVLLYEIFLDFSKWGMSHVLIDLISSSNNFESKLLVDFSKSILLRSSVKYSKSDYLNIAKNYDAIYKGLDLLPVHDDIRKIIKIAQTAAISASNEFDSLVKQKKRLFVNNAHIGFQEGIKFSFLKRNQAEEIQQYQPEVVLVFSVEFDYNIYSIWENYLKNSGLKFCIICFSYKEYYAKYQSNHLKTVCPIYSEELGFDIGLLGYIKSLKLLLYPGNYARNWVYFYNLPRLEHPNKEIKHIHIGHGDSDKASSYVRAQKIYDYILLADESAIKRYESNNIYLPKSSFLKMGAPTMPNIYVIKAPRAIKNVLYLPTFEGNVESTNYSSLEKISKILINFVRNSDSINLLFSPHPSTGIRLNEYAESVNSLNEVVKFSKQNKIELFNKSDAAICDISGVASEYLFTCKPIIIPIHDKKIIDLLNLSELSKIAYLWDVSCVSLDLFLKSIEEDPLFESREKFRFHKFAGAINFSESVINFDKALDFAIKNQLQPINN